MPDRRALRHLGAEKASALIQDLEYPLKVENRI